jgi:hypothetical protein
MHIASDLSSTFFMIFFTLTITYTLAASLEMDPLQRIVTSADDIQCLCLPYITQTPKSLRPTGRKPRLDTPHDWLSSIPLLQKLSPTTRSAVLTQIDLSANALRRNILDAYGDTIPRISSLRDLGHMSDDSLEHSLCRLYEHVYQRHLEVLIQKVMEVLGRRPISCDEAKSGAIFSSVSATAGG